MNPDPRYIPLRRPHFQLRDSKLFFLISKRPYIELDSDEIALWNAIDGVNTIGALNERFPKAGGLLLKFHERELIELAPVEWPQDRRRVLVIEPHMDDAVLSVGGLMWQKRMRCEFTVASVAGRSNFTSYHKIHRDFFDVDVVTALRRAESELVMRVLGGKHLVLDGLDAPLRYQPGNWTLEWFMKNRRSISAFINHSACDAEVDACAARIERLLMENRAAEVWIPLGIGTSADHETTRNACLRALTRRDMTWLDLKVLFYQDVPYAMDYPGHAKRILEALISNGAEVERMSCDVTEAMSEKLRLISIFASQFKMSYMQPKVEKTARLVMGAGIRSCECLMKLDKIPERWVPFELYSGRDDVLALRRQLVKWYSRNRTARRLAILCLIGVGRWKENMEVLLRCFPETVFDVHITDDACDETERFCSPRIMIHPVHGQAKGWIVRLFKLFIWPTRPLVVVTSTKLRHLIPLIRIVFVHAKPLPTTTMNHFVMALIDMDRAGSASDPRVFLEKTS